MDVYAWTAPEGLKDLFGEERERVKIATIELQTKLYTSEAGDNRLFFQHFNALKDYRSFPKEWRLNNHVGTDFPDFHREKIPKERWGGGDFPALKGLTKKDRKKGDWPWPIEEQAAEDMYKELIADTSTGGCPFSWLFV